MISNRRAAAIRDRSRAGAGNSRQRRRRLRKYYTAPIRAGGATVLLMRTHRGVGLSILIAIPFAAVVGVRCGGNSGPTGPVGGPVSGALDVHCGDPVEATAVGLCQTGNEPDAGEPDGGVPISDYGDTMFNAEGNDDDCKYHVSWTSTPVRKGANVTFTVTLTKLADGTPATGAGVRAEVYLNDTHPAAPPPQAAESSGGNYAVGPIMFDAPGNWTVRFHFYEQCSDVPEDSPHGHAAFFVRVPDPSAAPDTGTY
jgi:hypothetical protein